MKNDELKVGTLFSGIGAPEEALKELGIKHKVVFACDIDKSAKETYLLNHKCDKFYDNINEMTGKSGEVDLIVFGFCCQPFSVSGKKLGFKDERGRLVFKAIEIVKNIKPKYFIAENVVGFKRNRGAFETVVSHLKKIGYRVGWEVLNSLNFGIPQRRERIFIVGIRNDINKEYKTMTDVRIPYPSLKYFLDPNNKDKRYLATKNFLAKSKVKDRFKNFKRDYMPCITHSISRNGSSGEYISYVAATNRAIGVPRKPTPDEVKKLFGFSNNFKIPEVTMTKKYLLLGNTMVVPVIKKVIEGVIIGC